MSELRVFIAGKPAGTLAESPNGSLSFTYDEAYAGVPLSLAMPLSNRIYLDKVVRPFLFGLLPDDIGVRRSLGREYGVSGNNPFALLSHIGFDCPGAVQFFTSAEIEGIAQNEILTPIADEEIARRLSKGRTNENACWETNREHWSLGGQQSKFALREKSGTWYSCEGTAATTHIFKPGIPDLKLEALNELICLKTAKECGIAAADASYETFCGESAIIVSRYDRVTTPDGSVIRLHQEDFCQALGVLPENKYTEEGGPNANRSIALCKRTGSAARANIASFIDMLFFNYLIGAPDAHGKNYSMLLDTNIAFIAPLYDVASMLPYTDRPFDIKVAMGIGGKNKVGLVGKDHLRKLVELNGLENYGLSTQSLADRLEKLAQRIPIALRRAFDEHAGIPKIDELQNRFLPKADEVCGMALARLENS